MTTPTPVPESAIFRMDTLFDEFIADAKMGTMDTALATEFAQLPEVQAIYAEWRPKHRFLKRTFEKNEEAQAALHDAEEALQALPAMASEEDQETLHFDVVEKKAAYEAGLARARVTGEELITLAAPLGDIRKKWVSFFSMRTGCPPD